MTSPVISIRDSATVAELATLMLQQRINPGAGCRRRPADRRTGHAKWTHRADRSPGVRLLAPRFGRELTATRTAVAPPAKIDIRGIRATRAIVDLDAIEGNVRALRRALAGDHSAHGRRQGRRVRARCALGRACRIGCRRRIARSSDSRRRTRCCGRTAYDAPIVLLGSIDASRSAGGVRGRARDHRRRRVVAGVRAACGTSGSSRVAGLGSSQGRYRAASLRSHRRRGGCPWQRG